MKRLFTAMAAMLAILFSLAPATVHADMESAAHKDGSLGFHSSEAPIGIRWWFAEQKVGLDLGFGFQSTPAPSYSDEKLTSYSIEVGVPYVIQSWSRAHFLVRPGFLYTSQQFQADVPPAAFDTNDGTTFTVVGELEGELFLADNVSVSASHGIRFSSFNPPGPGDSITSFSTFGNNFTNIGFHFYMFGGSH